MSGDLRREVRREIDELRLGEGTRACVICGETTPGVLRRCNRELIEFHHLAGRNNDSHLGMFLCLTHHTQCTRLMMDHGIPLSAEHHRVLLERLTAVLQGLAVFFEIAARLMHDWTRLLTAQIAGLDREWPEWRYLEESA